MMAEDTVIRAATMNELDSDCASGESSVGRLVDNTHRTTAASDSVENPGRGHRHLPPRWNAARRSTGKLVDLPLEILGMIFKFSTVYCVRLSGVDIRAVLKPFICAAVCPRWYQAALSTLSLWTQIGVPGGNKGVAEYWPAWKERVAVSLVRSGACLLDIAFQSTYGSELKGDPESTAAYTAIFSLLVQNSYRWRTLFATASPFTLSLLRDPAIGFLREPTPLLEYATLRDFEGDSLPTGRFLPFTPRLRTMELYRVSHAFIDCRSPYGSVTRLTVSILDADNFLRVMTRFPSLTTLKLDWDDYFDWDGTDISTGTHVLLSELTSLVLSEPVTGITDWSFMTPLGSFPTGSDMFSPILDRLRAPKLRSLTLCAEHIYLVRGFLSSNASAITELEISSRCGGVPTRCTVPFLSSFTELVRLRVFDTGFPTSFIDQLGKVASEIWPRLQRLEFRGIRDLPVPEVLEQFFAKRYFRDKPVCSYPVLDFDFEGCGIPQRYELSIRSIIEAERARRAGLLDQDQPTSPAKCNQLSVKASHSAGLSALPLE